MTASLHALLLAGAIAKFYPVLAFLPMSSSSSASCSSPFTGSNHALNVRRGREGAGIGSGGTLAVVLAATATRRNILAGVGGSILSLPLLGEVYSRLGPRDVASLVFGDDHRRTGLGDDDLTSDVEEVTLVFHGAGGQDQYTDELMANLRAKCAGRGQHAAMIDWSTLSSNILQASFSGQRVGREAARRLLERCCNSDNGTCNLKRVHLIGISVGAFAADEACAAIKARLGSDVACQLTLLDPFQQRGVIGTGFGNANFGRTADYAIHYLNTDDPVPSTNAPLTKYCAVMDITKLRPEEIFGHDWPVVYYSGIEKRLNGGSGDVLGFVPEKDRLLRGTVIVAND
jgi:hypothetical protein